VIVWHATGVVCSDGTQHDDITTLLVTSVN